MSAVEVAPGVWRAGTRYVNWYAVDAVDAGAEGVTGIDAELPRYDGQLEASLHALPTFPVRPRRRDRRATRARRPRAAWR